MKIRKELPAFLILYYLFLLMLETPILFNVGVPSMPIRLVYMAMVIVPIWVYNISYLPMVILASYSVSKFGTAVTLMPTDVWYYVPVFILFALHFKGSKEIRGTIPQSVFVLCVCVFVVDLITSQTVHDLFLCIIILIALFFYCVPEIDNDSYNKIFSNVFIVTSIILSLELVLSGDRYSQSYEYTDMERILWADPNYLGGVIGMGGCVAAIMLFREKTLSVKIYLITALLLITTALVINASRGALLALTVGISIILIGGGMKNWQKIVFLGAASIFVYILYNSSFFELLQYRIENDSGGGSGRTDIWLIKWKSFINNSSIPQLIFGMGYDNGYRSGFTYGRAFHNDFLAFLVDYGVVGLIAFLGMFLYPIRLVSFKNKEVIGCIVYLIIISMTLEPLSLGVLAYYFFWLYACFQALKARQVQSLSKNLL